MLQFIQGATTAIDMERDRQADETRQSSLFLARNVSIAPLLILMQPYIQSNRQMTSPTKTGRHRRAVFVTGSADDEMLV